MPRSLQPPSLYTVKAIAILDNDGRRILANYYDRALFPTIKEERAFEKNLFQKTHKANADIIMLDGLTCLYRSNVDLFFYVMGDCHENEVGLFFSPAAKQSGTRAEQVVVIGGGGQFVSARARHSRLLYHYYCILAPQNHFGVGSTTQSISFCLTPVL